MTTKELASELKALQKEAHDTSVLLHPEEKEKEIVELEQKMQDPGFWKDQAQAQKVSQRQSHLRAELDEWKKLEKDIADALEMTADESLAEELEKTYHDLRARFEKMSVAVLLHGPHDERNAIIAIHAGAGGTEAQDWSAMLYRMLIRYAERHGWKTTVVDEHAGAEAGFKSIVFEVQGVSAY